MKKLLPILLMLLLSSALLAQEQQEQLDPSLPFIVVFPKLYGDFEARVCVTIEQFYIFLLANNELIMRQIELQTALTQDTRDLLEAIMDYVASEQVDGLWEAMKPIIDGYWEEFE